MAKTGGKQRAPAGADESSFELYRAGGTTDDISLMITLVLVVRRFRNQMEERLRAIGQTAGRMEALGAIMNMQGAKSQSDIARRLGLEGATITRIVDILARDGLVNRRTDPGDRRINLIEITPAGEQALREIFAVYDEMRDFILEGIPESDKRTVMSVLRSMMGRLDLSQSKK